MPLNEGFLYPSSFQVNLFVAEMLGLRTDIETTEHSGYTKAYKESCPDTVWVLMKDGWEQKCWTGCSEDWGDLLVAHQIAVEPNYQDTGLNLSKHTPTGIRYRDRDIGRAISICALMANDPDTFRPKK
jgi:hypothetical protein